MSAAAVAPVRANATQFPGFSPRFRVVSSGMGGAFTSAMTSSTRRLVAASCVTAVVVAMATGCGGPPKVRSAAGERLPANGAASAVPASTLPSKTIAREDWNKALAERLKPSCDAREGTRTADARNLEGAGKIIGTWTEFSTQKGKSSTADGKKVGAGPEPTRKVDSVGLTCAQGRSTIQVNGVQYPFDIAWVVAGEGTGPTVSGNEGAGQFAMIQALSFKDKRVVFAKVFVPSDANNDTDDTVIVSSLEGYLPDDADEPIVRAVSERGNPKLETFVRAKGAEEGISFQVPQQDALGSARYLSIARFDVARQ
jgi:hypothetical protein